MSLSFLLLLLLLSYNNIFGNIGLFFPILSMSLDSKSLPDIIIFVDFTDSSIFKSIVKVF